MTVFEEIIIAIVGSGAISAFITHRFTKAKTDGDASEAYARASEIVANQNQALSAKNDLLLAKIALLEAKIDTLIAENRNLRLALGKELSE